MESNRYSKKIIRGSRVKPLKSPQPELLDQYFLFCFFFSIVNLVFNLVPRVLSYPPYGARERETLENAGYVSPRIWEIKNKRFGGRAGKCEICLYRS